MVDFVSIDKLSPVDVANRTLDGMETGIMEIDVDERASSMRRAMRDDPDGLVMCGRPLHCKCFLLMVCPRSGAVMCPAF